MRALVYGVSAEPRDVPADAGALVQNLARTPTALRDIPDPILLHDDWVITRPRLTGICGSDSKQILMDFGADDADNALAAFCSFPQVMGHEVVADVIELGPRAREWSPLYFKEINWVGSNAFGIEEMDGVRKHAIAHYLDLVLDGRIDLRPMLTHTFGLPEWRDAFHAIADQGRSGAVKVAIDQHQVCMVSSPVNRVRRHPRLGRG